MKAEIIAEIGSNWEGNLTTARKIIRECKEAGADGVKFQMWRASDLYEKAHPRTFLGLHDYTQIVEACT